MRATRGGNHRFIRHSAHYLLAPGRETLLFLFRHPRQNLLAACIPSEGALDGSCGCSIYLNRLSFDVVVRFVMTVRSKALNDLMIHRPVSRLLVRLRRPSRIHVGGM